MRFIDQIVIVLEEETPILFILMFLVCFIIVEYLSIIDFFLRLDELLVLDATIISILIFILGMMQTKNTYNNTPMIVSETHFADHRMKITHKR